MRISIGINSGDLARLDAIAKEMNSSRSHLIAEAIHAYLDQRNVDPIDAAFGLWKDRDEDGLSYQRRMRAEWG